MRLTGWTRLWIVVSTLYLVVVIAIASSTLPTEESIDSKSVLEYVSTPTLLAMKAAAEAPNGWTEEKVTHKSIPVPVQLNQAERAAYVAVYEVAVASALSARRRIHTLGALVWWLVPTTVVFILGFAAGWVRKGFRNSTAPNKPLG